MAQGHIPKHPLLLTVGDFAHLLRASPTVVRLWDRQGRIRRVQIGRLVRYSMAHALEIAEQGISPPGTFQNRDGEDRSTVRQGEGVAP